MTELRLTLLLGPRETIEAGERAMPDMDHCLGAAYTLEAWDPDEVDRLLMMGGGVFRQAIASRKHEEPPPPPAGTWSAIAAEIASRKHEEPPTPKRLPPEVEAAIEATPPTPALVAIGQEETLAVTGLLAKIARALAPEAWAAADASLLQAERVLAVFERWGQA